MNEERPHLEPVGYCHDWPEGYPIRRSFMINEPEQNVEDWYQVYRIVEDSGRE